MSLKQRIQESLHRRKLSASSEPALEKHAVYLSLAHLFYDVPGKYEPRRHNAFGQYSDRSE